MSLGRLREVFARPVVLTPACAAHMTAKRSTALDINKMAWCEAWASCEARKVLSFLGPRLEECWKHSMLG